MDKRKNIAGILLMGGSGNRFQSDLPKQFHTIQGRALYLYTLDRFLKKKIFTQIILVCHEHHLKRVEKEVPSFIKVVAGGIIGQKSSYYGLPACNLSKDNN